MCQSRESHQSFGACCCGYGTFIRRFISTKEEQEITEGCRRLIENAIICWNYLYLSQKIAEEKNPERKREVIDAIKNGSVVTWRHINLHGEYDFSEEKLQDSIGLKVPKILKLRLP